MIHESKDGKRFVQVALSAANWLRITLFYRDKDGLWQTHEVALSPEEQDFILRTNALQSGAGR